MGEIHTLILKVIDRGYTISKDHLPCLLFGRKLNSLRAIISITKIMCPQKMSSADPARVTGKLHNVPNVRHLNSPNTLGTADGWVVIVHLHI